MKLFFAALIAVVICIFTFCTRTDDIVLNTSRSGGVDSILYDVKELIPLRVKRSSIAVSGEDSVLIKTTYNLVDPATGAYLSYSDFINQIDTSFNDSIDTDSIFILNLNDYPVRRYVFDGKADVIDTTYENVALEIDPVNNSLDDTCEVVQYKKTYRPVSFALGSIVPTPGVFLFNITCKVDFIAPGKPGCSHTMYNIFGIEEPTWFCVRVHACTASIGI